MRALRNIAIIALLALIVAFAPGRRQRRRRDRRRDHDRLPGADRLAGYQLYRQNRLTFCSLTDGRRALLCGSLGAIVLMIAGADELTATGGGAAWSGSAVVGARDRRRSSRVWGEARSSD